MPARPDEDQRSPATVIRGKMKHRVHAIHRGARHAGLPEIGLNEIDCSLCEWFGANYPGDRS